MTADSLLEKAQLGVKEEGSRLGCESSYTFAGQGGAVKLENRRVVPTPRHE
jgi:hypothetical protein